MVLEGKMARNLSDFASEKLAEDIKIFDEKMTENVENLNEETLNSAEEVYNKYKDYSQEDLANEFLSESKKRLQNGELSLEKLSQTAQLLSPYLNVEQKQFLDDLLKKLDE